MLLLLLLDYSHSRGSPRRLHHLSDDQVVAAGVALSEVDVLVDRVVVVVVVVVVHVLVVVLVTLKRLLRPRPAVEVVH